MITQTISLDFKVTGQDAYWLLEFCQKNNTKPQVVFEEFLQSFKPNKAVKTPIKKSDYAGGLAEFANPALIPLEDQAVEMAIKAKYGID